MASGSAPRQVTPVSEPAAGSRSEVAQLIDEVSNRLQVILGYAQILHELDREERDTAVEAIGRECDQLRETLRTLTGISRDESGAGPWQPTPIDRHLPRPEAAR